MRRDVTRADGRTEHSTGALTLPPPPAGEDFSISPQSIRESFQAWLQGVTADARGRPPARALTPGEAAAVSLATVRESRKHRRWPGEVVERFLAAEVVTCPPAAHPATGESTEAARRFNLLRVPGGGFAAIAHILRR